MKLQKCSNGHFYDGDKYATCPHCSGGQKPAQSPGSGTIPLSQYSSDSAEDVTRPLNVAGAGMNQGIPTHVGETEEIDVTIPMGGSGWASKDGGFSSNPVASSARGGMDPTMPVGRSGFTQNAHAVPAGNSEPVEDGPTVGFYPPIVTTSGETLQPPVGWLVCVSGKQAGREFRLIAGRNTIGRDAGNAVQISGEETVSRSNHAAVVYEPRQNKFFAVPGESRSLAYLNNDVLLSQTEMKKNDRLEIGKAVLMLIPCCDDTFHWE